MLKLLSFFIKCYWKIEDDHWYNSYYISSCGDKFIFNEEGPFENNFKYCPFCGRKIKIKEEQGN
jgi:hypothetical protein